MSDILTANKKKASTPKWFLPSLIVLAIILFVPCCTYYMLQHSVGIDVQRDQLSARWHFVPEDAKEINYFEPGGYGPALYLEFSVPEESFLRIAEKQQWRVEEIFKDSPRRVVRPEAFFKNTGEDRYPQVFNGWHWEEFSKTDPDSGYTVTFDRDNNRVFYAYHRR